MATNVATLNKATMAKKRFRSSQQGGDRSSRQTNGGDWTLR